MVFAKPFGRTRLVYFVGIGGIGMSALAKIVYSMGYHISGSDLHHSENVSDLEKLGIEVAIGHQRSHITSRQDIDVVVTSSAISPANPEILAARDKQIPIITRGELLAEIMRLKEGIAIAGTHGKTTTTSIVSAIFHEAGYSPTAVIGGRWSGIHSNAQLGESDIMICETDESDGSFLKLSPVFSIVTNIDIDHMDYYLNEERLILHFLEFINRVPFYGKAFLCFDDNRIAALKPNLKKPYATYGLQRDSNKPLSASNSSIRTQSPTTTHSLDIYGKILKLNRFSSDFEVTAYGKALGPMKLQMPGEHNVLNALPAIGVALEAGITVDPIKAALSQFKGVERRLSVIGKWRNLTIMDDYGHHPTEIKVTLHTLQSLYKTVIVAFQPHRYSRTLEHYKQFAKELVKADKIYLLPIYSAGEKPIENVSSAMIAQEITALAPKKTIHLVPDLESLSTTIVKKEQATDGIFLTIGAGTVYKAAKELANLEH
ncbi:UDP-N-acetylmuramate--L-alanine ligase [Spirochaetota bacterium]|nr:UDP-N-acetylmuramate--L-alanine ligase [Spirochaetota bacterium]